MSGNAVVFAWGFFALLAMTVVLLALIADELRRIRKAADPTTVNVYAAKVSPEDEKSIRDAIRRAAQ